MTEPALLSSSDGHLDLKEASELLKVSVKTLIEWNNNNILKPSITTSGEVVYKREQIEKFIAIQKQSRNQVSSPAVQSSLEPQQVGRNKEFQTNIEKKENYKSSGSSKRKTYKYKVFGLVSFLSLAAVIFGSYLVYQNRSKPKPSSLLQKSEYFVPDNTHSTGSVPLLKLTSNHTSLTDDDLKNSLVETNAVNIKLTDDVLSTKDNDATKAAVLDGHNPPLPVLGIDMSNSASNFSSRPSVVDDSSVFDQDGYIKEQAITKDALATTATSNKSITDTTTFKQTFYPTLLAIGLLLIVFGLVTQPSIAGKGPLSDTSMRSQTQAGTQFHKVLNINQKADGSVVLSYRNEEYKVSKPELNSETDQFIQRLLGFVKDDTKEIDYNILEDENIDINTPLSKLVTRLGFVGLKRDLFFPRTSKNRVIFRKYLTEKDLVGLDLTSDQILRELVN